MMRLSRLTDYAVVVAAFMAGTPDGWRTSAFLSASVIAEGTGLPEPTVSKVLKLLGAGGIVVSARGSHGGYALGRTPGSISVSDIVVAVEGPITITPCVSGSSESCAIARHCFLCGRWNPVNAAIRTALENVTLADMLGGPVPLPAADGREEARQ